MSFGFTVLSVFYIILIIIPGIVFKRFFYQNNPLKQSGVGNFADRILTSIFCGLIIQLFATIFFTFIINHFWELNFDECFKRLNNIHKSLVKNELPEISYRQLGFIILEISISNFLAIILGFGLFKIIRIFKFDVKYQVLRFDSEWKYLFRDETQIFEFDSLKKFREFSSSQVDVLVKDQSGGTYLYSGYLHDFNVDKDGQLKNIVLNDAIRYSRKSGETETSKKDVPGHLMIIPFTNILNMNITYIYKIKTSKNRIFESIIYLFLIIVLLFILISPWFAQVLWYYKVFSVILLLMSWSGIVGLSTSLLGKTKEPMGNPAIIFLILFSIIPLYFGLKLLNFDIIQVLLQ